MSQFERKDQILSELREEYEELVKEIEVSDVTNKLQNPILNE
jgi:hypothetical protein